MDRKLKRMSRKNLLEILVNQSKRIDELESEIKAKDKIIKERKIVLDEAGSIAEASLKLNNIFEVAQKSADEYLINIKKMEDRLSKELQKVEKKSTSKKKK